ncbi:MAG: hypothetical protein VX938_04150, partial [Myxococcota bacterium]|nr:hypothetical protein [Myxococcota bacterium]
MRLPLGRWFILLALFITPVVGQGCGDTETGGDEEEPPAALCVEAEECTTSCGTTGTLTCEEDETAPGQCAPPVEADNGADDDCDGEIDEGLGAECEAGVIQPCLSFCATTGEKTCDQDGKWGPCEMEPESNLSMHCNGKDDDCDDSIDEDIGFLTCGAGDCAYQLPACVDGTIQSCPTKDGIDGLCDGLDDDCDGQIDEDSPIECDPLIAVSTLEDCTTAGCPSQWSMCVADSACLALLDCMGECPWLGDPVCGDGKCTGTESEGLCSEDCDGVDTSCGDGICEHNEPNTCEQDCESEVAEANGCVED